MLLGVILVALHACLQGSLSSSLERVPGSLETEGAKVVAVLRDDLSVLWEASVNPGSVVLVSPVRAHIDVVGGGRA